MTKKHQHCWHHVSRTTDGVGERGFDRECCCHCGTERNRFWVYKQDPKHGNFVEAKKLWFTGKRELSRG